MAWLAADSRCLSFIRQYSLAAGKARKGNKASNTSQPTSDLHGRAPHPAPIYRLPVKINRSPRYGMRMIFVVGVIGSLLVVSFIALVMFFIVLFPGEWLLNLLPLGRPGRFVLIMVR